jgi:hypothetical protein
VPHSAGITERSSALEGYDRRHGCAMKDSREADVRNGGVEAVIAVSVVVAALVAGCTGVHTGSSTQSGTGTEAGKHRSDFVPAPGDLITACHRTARIVGYRVPCPTRIPPGLTPFGGRPGCPLGIIGPGRKCPNTFLSWRGWVVGSSTTTDEHLVITASPKPLGNYAKVVNGLAWYPKARVTRLGRLNINGWRMRVVFVPPDTNDGSAFADHVVLIWTVGQHTYGIGFHDVSGIRQTLGLDKELAKGISLIGP